MMQWEIHFSPNDLATASIVAYLDHANLNIFVQAYSFTSAPIAESLIKAHNRHVKVEVLVDKSQLTARGSVIQMLVGNGVPVFVDDKHAIAHNKVIILDGVTVFTGSFNFTNAAEHNNAENSIRLTDARIAEAYFKNWQEHKKHSLSVSR
jgi:phosphatidylserine/phosphatidylglycerophosphate/cardiolipin synthase-like enzyme